MIDHVTCVVNIRGEAIAGVRLTGGGDFGPSVNSDQLPRA